MKSIRWGGLIVVVIMVLASAAALLFAGSILKPVMESSFTRMNGAKVDIDNVDVSYSPFTVAINNMQIADPLRPMVNTAQIKKIKFSMSVAELFFGKAIIDEASVSGIQVDTPRRKSGLIKKTDKKKEPEAGEEKPDFIAMPEIALPNVKEILAVEPLLSDKLINELEEDLAKTESQWQEISGTLPDKEKWQQYENRYKKIQLEAKGDSVQKLAAIKDAKQLSKDLKAEAQLVKQAKQQLSTDLDRLNAEFKAVKAAPAADIARIKDKYNLGNLNAENISQMLFGDKISGYVTLAKQWYRRIEPYLPEKSEAEPPKVERSKGIDVAFREYQPRPDFYVAVAAITASLPRGQFEGTATAISSDQSINKEPMRLKLSGVELSNKESEEISAEFNYVDKDSGFSRFNYAVVKSQIDDFVLSRSSRLPLTMKQALMDLKLDALLQQGSLKGTVKTVFNQVRFDSADSSSMLASSFQGVNSFDLNGKFSGSMSDLSINIDSNLDNQLGEQLKVSLNEKKLEFENDLRARLDEKLEQPLNKLEAKKASLESVKTRIDEREAELQNRLASLQQTIDEEKQLKKQEATDKLKDKLRDKLGF